MAVDLPAWWRWRDGPITAGPCALVDIDGVLADATHRQHHLASSPKDWAGFFRGVGADPPLAEGVVLVRLLSEAVAVILVTGRPARTADDTMAWLSTHGVRHDLVAFRADDDRRPVTLHKRDATRALRRAGFLPVLALDDDAATRAGYAQERVPFLLVGPREQSSDR